MGEEKEKILDILIEERLYNALEVSLSNNKEYRTVQAELQEAINKLEEMGLNKEQDGAVDRVLSITNQSGAIYGAAAYRQGFYDGIRLMSELEHINSVDDLSEKKAALNLRVETTVKERAADVLSKPGAHIDRDTGQP